MTFTQIEDAILNGTILKQYPNTGRGESCLIVVIQMYEKIISWFALSKGIDSLLEPDRDGVYRSEIFPGLWLDPATIWTGDLQSMIKTLKKGLDSDEHAAFLK